MEISKIKNAILNGATLTLMKIAGSKVVWEINTLKFCTTYDVI